MRGRDERSGEPFNYATSQRIRERIEEAFVWIKAVAGQDKTASGGLTALVLPSPSPLPPTIWSDRPNCSEPRHKRAGRLPTNRKLAEY